MSAEHIHFFLQLRDQLKLYHWQTRVYARHMATDKILDALDGTIDSFVEIYIGHHGRPRLTGKNSQITLQNWTEAGAVRGIHAAIRYLEGPLTRDIARNSDLLNLRDELIGDLGQLLYLMGLA